MTFSVIITRADPWDTAYEIFAKRGAAPLEYGDGIYLGYAPIQPWENAVAFAWPEGSNAYGFLVAPVQRRDLGVYTQAAP